MNTLNTNCQAAADFELRFCSLFDAGRGYSFPCDQSGNVDIDALSWRSALIAGLITRL